MKKLLSIFVFVLIANILFAQDFSFMHGGIERTYRVHIPEGFSRETNCPMVINMHGAGSNAIEQQFYSQFDSIANLNNFIVVYPNGIGGFWNIYSDSSVDDVGFISALIDTMSVNYNIDLKRVYSTGMSMGGFMSHRLGCQLNNKIAAVGSVAGLLAYTSCTPFRSVPICQIHGTADSTVLYNLVPNLMDFWDENNGCTDLIVEDLPDIDTTDQSTVTLTTYKPCDDGVEMLLYTINGGGHSWPGAFYYIDITNQDIHASVELWNFFSQYTLPDYASVADPIKSDEGLKIYPNPVIQTAIIEVPGSAGNVWALQIMDISGRLIREEKHTSWNNKIAFSRDGLKSGIYLIEVASERAVFRKKMILR